MNILAYSWQIILKDKHPLEYPKIDRCGQIKGDDLFAVRMHGRCLNKEGKWEYEPIPSSRDEDFLSRCRFETFEAATRMVERIYI
jgi:hypothetical protein